MNDREAFEKWYWDKWEGCSMFVANTKEGTFRKYKDSLKYINSQVQRSCEGWQAAIALQQADIARLRDALVKIATMHPSTAQPDPHAHSWKAFAEHTMAYATDMKFVAINALKENT
jgi:hypothetical protein